MNAVFIPNGIHISCKRIYLGPLTPLLHILNAFHMSETVLTRTDTFPLLMSLKCILFEFIWNQQSLGIWGVKVQIEIVKYDASRTNDVITYSFKV